MPEMVKIDYLYGANWSLWLDLKILLRTIPLRAAAPRAVTKTGSLPTPLGLAPVASIFGGPAARRRQAAIAVAASTITGMPIVQMSNSPMITADTSFRRGEVPSRNLDRLPSVSSAGAAVYTTDVRSRILREASWVQQTLRARATLG